MKSHYRLLQIDIMKGLAIVSVIVLHSVLNQQVLMHTFSALFIWQAVPVFIVILALNASMSFRRKGYTSLRELYSKSYVMNRFERLVFPTLLIFVLLLFLGLAETHVTGVNHVYLGYLTLIGYLPIRELGNFFVTVVLQFVVLFPLLFYFYARRPKLTVLTCFSVDLLFQFVAPLVFASVADFLYEGSIFRFLSAIALGLWISDDLDLFSRRNRFILAGAAVGFIYLVSVSLSLYTFPFFLWTIQSPWTFFYAALLVLVGIKYLPESPVNRFVATTAHAGRLSWHIFLVQMIYFEFFWAASSFLNKKFAGEFTLLNTPYAPLMTAIFVLILGISIIIMARILETSSGLRPRQTKSEKYGVDFLSLIPLALFLAIPFTPTLGVGIVAVLAINVVVCCAAGLAFSRAEQRLRNVVRRYISIRRNNSPG
jgi:peptidoglycan/LPS O-acetylase OafA/YrhL